MPRWLNPSRRFLLLPAWFWLIPLLLMVPVARSMGRPEDIPDPPARAEIFRDFVLFTPEGDSYRFVQFGKHKGVTPLWALSTIDRTYSQVNWSMGVGASVGERAELWFKPGLYTWRKSVTYELTASRFDEGWMQEKGDPLLPADQRERLRPLVVAELNRRFPEERRGDRLEDLLTHGASVSGWFCKQNVAILLAWFFALLGALAVCSMFVPPRIEKKIRDAFAAPFAH